MPEYAFLGTVKLNQFTCMKVKIYSLTILYISSGKKWHFPKYSMYSHKKKKKLNAIFMLIMTC